MLLHPHTHAPHTHTLQGTHRYAILLFEQPGLQTIPPPTRRAYFQTKEVRGVGLDFETARLGHWALVVSGSAVRDGRLICCSLLLLQFAKQHGWRAVAGVYFKVKHGDA
jgi:hypothetical protein